MEVTSDYLSDNKTVAVLPFLSYFLCVPIIMIWMWASTYIFSIGTPVFEANTLIAQIRWDDPIIRQMEWILLFAMFWLVAWIIAVQRFVIGCTVCMWYYSVVDADGKHANDMTTFQLAYKWACVYHCGSIALGSFIIAVVQTIKAIFEYFVN